MGPNTYKLIYENGNENKELKTEALGNISATKWAQLFSDGMLCRVWKGYTGCGKQTSFFIWHFIFKKGS
jgi:hypothetical protein